MYKFKSGFWSITLITTMLLSGTFLGGCSSGETKKSDEINTLKSEDTKQVETTKKSQTITFCDLGWESINLQNNIAKIILENGYGYKTKIVSGQEATMHNSISSGDIDVIMEYWLYDERKAKHDENVKSGKIFDSSKVFEGNDGLWVPAYVVKGDDKRNIKAVAPELKVLSDLKKYSTVFKDPKAPEKGIIQFGAESWESNKVLSEKLKKQGVDKIYTFLTPKTEDGMKAYFSKNYEKGLPFVAYNYTPSAISGKYDMIFIPDDMSNGSDKVDVYVTINKSMKEKAPDAVEFFKNYKMGIDMINKSLSIKEDKKLTIEDTAKDFIKNNESVWSSWVSPSALELIKKSN